MSLILFLTLMIISHAPPVCGDADKKPLGEPRGCVLVEYEVCCDWHYVIDRYCTGVRDNECSPVERAADEMNALRSQENWCYQFPCGWVLNGDGYYTHWESEDVWSIANRKVRRLVMNGRYKRAKQAARQTLRRLIKWGWCEKGKHCDDHLEFVAGATRKGLDAAVREWIHEGDI